MPDGEGRAVLEGLWSLIANGDGDSSNDSMVNVHAMGRSDPCFLAAMPVAAVELEHQLFFALNTQSLLTNPFYNHQRGALRIPTREMHQAGVGMRHPVVPKLEFPAAAGGIRYNIRPGTILPPRPPPGFDPRESGKTKPAGGGGVGNTARTTTTITADADAVAPDTDAATNPGNEAAGTAQPSAKRQKGEPQAQTVIKTLPEGWRCTKDAVYKKLYYWHIDNPKQTTWNMPRPDRDTALTVGEVVINDSSNDQDANANANANANAATDAPRPDDVTDRTDRDGTGQQGLNGSSDGEHGGLLADPLPTAPVTHKAKSMAVQHVGTVSTSDAAGPVCTAAPSDAGADAGSSSSSSADGGDNGRHRIRDPDKLPPTRTRTRPPTKSPQSQGRRGRCSTVPEPTMSFHSEILLRTIVPWSVCHVARCQCTVLRWHQCTHTHTHTHTHTLYVTHVC